jgi:pimeloyl-ACP methyl ester carboxylesterase/DNA-binding CsgD family transcriptional regulator
VAYAEDTVEKQTGFFRFDGRRVAYATVGDGQPLILPAWWVSHVTEDWQFESFRHFVETLATKYRVVRYDRLGTGLSDRERPDDTLTLEYEVELLEALVDHVTDEPVTLFGISCGACSSVVYAVRHPDRVERLVLYGAYACGLELGPLAAREALVGLVRDAWGLGSRALVDIFVPSVSPRERDAFGAYQRSAATARTAGDLLQLTYEYDVRDVLPQVDAPTLVLHRTRDRAVPIAAGREVASLVPGARLVSLDGDAHLPWHGSTDEAFAEVAGFLGLPAPAAEPVSADGIEELSRREREILGLVAEGLSDAEIARRLVLSPHTVHRHVANIRRKLGLRSRSAAAAAAARAGLV